VAAAGSWSDGALKLATIVKLTRTLMIVPVTFALALITAKKNGTGGKVKILKVFPYFVLGFLAASLISSTGVIPYEYSNFCVQAGKFLIVAAMGAIGLSTNIVSLIKNGKRPIILGASCWIAVAFTTVITLLIIKVW